MYLDDYSTSFQYFKYIFRHMPKLQKILIDKQTKEEEQLDDEGEESCEDDSDFDIDFGNKTKP